MSKSRFSNAMVGVLMGGDSRERDVSLNTGAAISAALRQAGHRVVDIDWRVGALAPLLEAGIEVAFLALHGGYGEDGSVQGLLNAAAVTYTGSGVLASALAMDKVRAKRLFERAGLATPEYEVVSAGWMRAKNPVDTAFGLPCVVKPVHEGSSVGVNIAWSESELEAALVLAAQGHNDILVERFIEGRELSVGIFDDEVLGTVEIAPHEGFYDYEAKYLSGTTRYLIPPPIDQETRNAVEALAMGAYRALGCRGVARVDVMLDEAGQGFLLEVNTLPGMTETSLVPKLAEARGESFVELVKRMLEAAQVDPC